MAQGRARSMERIRGATQENAVLGRLTDVLERMWQDPRPRVGDTFKAPSYDGQGNVEYFIRQFGEVAAANRWQEAAQLLHLREALKDTARDCGQAGTVAAIYMTLRARFGITEREARSRLATLKKEYRTTLQEHAMEVERLVDLAYPALPEDHRASMAVDVFCGTLGNAYLQRHLLAVETPTLGDAVRAGNEYLQIRPTQDKGGSGAAIRCMDDTEEPSLAAATVAEAGTGDVLQTLLQAMQQLTGAVEQLQHRPERRSRSGDLDRRTRCWGCGQPGHLRNSCPRKAGTADQAAAVSGNEKSLQQ